MPALFARALFPTVAVLLAAGLLVVHHGLARRQALSSIDPAMPDTVTAGELHATLAPAPAMPLSADDTDVLLVALCTMRRDRLGLYGHDQPTSPFLDQLGAAGVVFEQAFAQAPWTRPSMGALMTGRWPRVLGLDNPGGSHSFSMVLGDQHTLLSEAMSAAGFATIASVANPNLKTRFGFAQGFDAYREPDATYAEGTHIPHGWEVVDDILELEAAVPVGQRLYARAVLLDPHHTPRPRARYLSLFEGLGRRLRLYDAAVRTVDAELARLVTALRKRRPNLLVVVAADHGEGLNRPRHHGPEHGNHLYRTTVQTPLLVQHPALPRGRRVPGLVMNIDVHPTVLDLLGLPVDHPVDGRSQAAVVRAESDDTGHDKVFAETFFRRVHKATVFDGKHQLVRTWKRGALDGPHTDALYAAADWRADDDLADRRTGQRDALAQALDTWHQLQARLSATVGQAGEGKVDPDTRRMLEALGYTE